MKNETERDALAMTLLGKSAQDLNPLIEAGADRMSELGEQAQAAGYVMSDKLLAAYGALDDQLQYLSVGATAAKNALGTVLLPVLTDLAGEGTALLGEFTNGVLAANGDIGKISQVVGDVLPKALNKIMEYVPDLLSLVMEIVSSLGTAVVDNLPILVETAGRIVFALLEGMIAALPQITEGALQLILALVEGLIENLPQIIEAAIQMVAALATGIAEALPELIPSLVQAVVYICQTLVSNIDLIIQAALALVTGLAQGILAAIPVLIAALPEIITSLIDTLLSSIPQIIETGVTLLTALIEALPDIITAIVAAIPQIIDGVITALTESLPLIIQAGIDLLVALIGALPDIIVAIIAAIPQIITSIIDALINSIPLLVEAGRALRDTYNFFDPVVFDESVQEFLRKKAELANYFDDSQTEDIFDYIPPQKTNQIYTPKKVVKLMIDKLEEENPDLFTDKDKTFADLYVKSGLYLTEIVKRLYAGLEAVIPDKDARLKNILEHQVYGFAPSEIIWNIARNFVFGGFTGIDDSHLKCMDLTETAKNGGGLDMKFDVVVGNPPYQDENVGDNNQATPVYNLFYDLAERVAPVYALISPARFLAEQGATPKEWNKKMLNDEHLNVEYFNTKSDEVFRNTDIKGGVVVIYRDKNKNFGSIDTFIPFEELRSVYHKVKAISSNNISNFVYSPDSYRFTDLLFKENPKLVGRTDNAHAKAVASSVFERYPEVFFEVKPEDDENYIQIYGRIGGERVYKYIKRKYLAPHPNLDKWKIFVPGANGTGAIGEILSTPVIGQPVIGHNQTFVSLGKFDTEFEATALLNYIKSKFGRAMLGIMKTTQNNQSQSTWSKVPLQDFTPQSDIDWTQSIPDIDRQLYAKYGLDEKEIAFIEEKVKAM